MKTYLSWSINERINFKSYWLSPYSGLRGVFQESEFNPSPYHKDSPDPLGWGNPNQKIKSGELATYTELANEASDVIKITCDYSATDIIPFRIPGGLKHATSCVKKLIAHGFRCRIIPSHTKRHYQLQVLLTHVSGPHKFTK